MATKRMLIDATHPEETRVVALHGNRLEDFDVEVESRRQLKGNIYLAKVTRVEPSLQAAFVEYGGNRHGFLAFSEIHPDYYQIPVADREALMAEHDAAAKADEEAKSDQEGEGADGSVETLGGGDDDEVEIRRPPPPKRNYKIQEVIKRRQIILVQVVKEERGTKGAALTTYLSLAGRYCVLMPNTARGGGISRKIGNVQDRKRLKKILAELKISPGLAVIVRTAGAERSKAEIKRDYEYLVRLWNQVRETTLDSTAPTLVYEEGDLIKRSIRDLYSRDIDEIIVAGEAGYRQAKDFMKLLIPSHAKKVQPYRDEAMPLLQRYQVESQLDAMHGAQVQLRSGGYIVIDPTEALVSIDVNSGRSTKERNIEETALKTNLEAAVEIARQLKLRDLAGLIVIDFIDMEVTRNQIQVERRLKDAMRSDRARIQIGRISPFGLLEMSRQRLRPSLAETSSEPCPHCGGTGILRSTDSAALAVLRAIEEEGMRRRASEVMVHVATPIALYILNQKREALAEIETRYEFSVQFASDDALIPPECRMERLATKPGAPADDQDDGDAEARENGGKRRRRRRRRGRKGGDEAQDAQVEAAETENEESEDDAAQGSEDEDGSKRRRRGRRGGRRRRKAEDVERTPEESSEESSEETGEEAAPEEAAEEQPAEDEAPETEAAAEVESEPEPEPEEEPETEDEPEDDEPKEDLSRTTTIDVDEHVQDSPPKQGWWRRLTS